MISYIRPPAPKIVLQGATSLPVRTSHKPAMGRVLKSLALALLTAVSVSALTAQMLPLVAASPNGRPAGCHEHSQKPPARQPASYVCCLAGHDSAIPQASYAPRPVLDEAASFVLCDSLIQIAGIGKVEFLPVSSGGPPGTTPLRI